MKFATGALSLIALVTMLAALAVANEATTVTVYKSPTCGCCSKWVRHLEQHGFTVETHDLRDVTPVKEANGVPRGLVSCHTALVGGYVVEGHVPASDVARLLEQRPPIVGLAVPKMPIGSPGMEGPNPEPYQVLSFDDKGRVAVFSSHKPATVGRRIPAASGSTASGQAP
ncbi:MAG: DUF411 domain-containing protein [Myxococcota bacterium]